MNNILEINGGDISCVFHKKIGKYEICISRYGECDCKIYRNFNMLIECYYFDDNMIDDFKKIIVVV